MQARHIIKEMVKIAREDAPWVWGYHPKDYSLSHAWMKNGKPNNMARNGLKFLRVDAALRRLVGDGDFRLAVIGPAKELRGQLEGAVAIFPFKTRPERWPG